LFTVYRGQGLSQADFHKLKNTEGGLMSFNNFLSTSLDREVSLVFAQSDPNNSDVIGVLFQITVDPSILSTPFANIRSVSNHQDEEEILFSMHAVFRIGKIKQINDDNPHWQVELSLTSDNDPQLHVLTERIREEIYPDEKGWYRLSYLLIKLGELNKAQEICEVLLDQTSPEHEKATIYHMRGWIKSEQGKYPEAIMFYEKSIQIKEIILSPTHSNLTNSYNNIASVYGNMGENSKALSYHEKALEIYQKTLPTNHLCFAACYQNMGLVYSDTGKYAKALSYYEKALEIFKKNSSSKSSEFGCSLYKYRFAVY